MTYARINPRQGLNASMKGLCVALGNFDGVHKGHQGLIAVAQAACDCPVAILTFEPNPMQFFAPDAPSAQLMRPQTMDAKLAGLGVAASFAVPFDVSLANMTDAEFAEKILVQDCGASQVVIGADFRFGKARIGNAQALVNLGKKFGFKVSVIAPIVDKALSHGETTHTGVKISSSTIRAHLTAGKPEEAAALLGHAWVMDGAVVTGEKQGRTLGFPTANLDIGNLLHPKHGVYAIRARLNRSGAWLDGVANFGRTPTTGLRAPLLEAHIFDFNADVYGHWVEVALISYLRPELIFGSVDELVTQMHKDSAQARDVLQKPRVAMPQ